MKKNILIIALLIFNYSVNAQLMTPEKLWSLNRVSPIGISDDGNSIIFSSTVYDIESNAKTKSLYKLPVAGGEAVKIESYNDIYTDPKISPNGKYKIISKEVKIKPVVGSDFYPKLEKSNVFIYDSLNYRHWDAWENGENNHLLIQDLNSDPEDVLDIMKDEPFDCPLKPFGGVEDYTWNNDGTKVVYASKKETGTSYAISTNTDIFSYDLETKITANLTEVNKGYDTNPAFSKEGTLAWLQMNEPGNEADKNDIIILVNDAEINLTQNWDGTVDSFLWSVDGKSIFFIAPTQGTKQLYRISLLENDSSVIKQITYGQHDITGLVGQPDNAMIVTRTDMNHAAEIYSVNLEDGIMTQLSHVNDSIYNEITLSNVEKRMVKTSDNKDMLVWVIYPPDFDPTKKYPTLLYCQGGPQSPLSQFYSFRWNFQLMAANGYIIVAPNRRGMPGYGVEWNEQISGDWGGQNIRDYLSAIDDLSKETYVDTDKLGCIGASYGGYSAFYLAGMHENRFKSFIAHDGIFNTRSMYGTTEELFFVNKDFGGSYWENPESDCYTKFNPITHVDKWDTPILIIQGGKDYRVPIGQGLEAFQAAQLRGIKSKLLYFPEENHWILTPQNGIVWQNEFFKWLSETLN